MSAARIAELLKPFLGSHDPGPGLISSISIYIDILIRWNSRTNLTAIRDPDQIITRHFGESLFAARHLLPLDSSLSFVVSPLPVADIGSGAGFPGIPLKLWSPAIALTLIESNHKKATFLREITRALTLTDINIQTTRAEDLHDSRFGLVTLRAVERFETILPAAAALVAPGGRLALLIGASQFEQATTALPQLTWHPPQPVPLSSSRILAVGTSPVPKQ